MEQLGTQEQIDWLTARVENRSSLQHGIQRAILNSLIRAEMFEEFLAEKFPRTKRLDTRTVDHTWQDSVWEGICGHNKIVVKVMHAASVIHVLLAQVWY